MTKTSFGKEINRLRIKKKLGLREFARRANISATYAGRIEKAIDPPPSEKQIKKFAEVLDVDPDKLFGLADKVNPDYLLAMKKSANLPTLISEITASSDSETLVKDLIAVAKKRNKTK